MSQYIRMKAYYVTIPVSDGYHFRSRHLLVGRVLISRGCKLLQKDLYNKMREAHQGYMRKWFWTITETWHTPIYMEVRRWWLMVTPPCKWRLYRISNHQQRKPHPSRWGRCGIALSNDGNEIVRYFDAQELHNKCMQAYQRSKFLLSTIYPFFRIF